MAGKDDNDSWEWQDDSFKLDSESPLALSRSLWDELSQSEADSRSLFSTPSTQIQEPQAVFITKNNEERRLCNESLESGNLRFKRRRMLHFSETQESSSLHIAAFKNYGSHMMDVCNDYVVSHQTTPGSAWLAKIELGDESYSSVEDVEQPTEIWMAKCFNDSEAQSCEEMKQAAPSHEISGTGKQDKNEWDGKTRQNFSTSQTESLYVHKPATPTIGAPLAYPFALLKPCGVQGDVTLSDINQRIQKPSSRLKKNLADPGLKHVPQLSCSGLSGKSVVALTKIQTEGNGTITIMRTKG